MYGEGEGTHSQWNLEEMTMCGERYAVMIICRKTKAIFTLYPSELQVLMTKLCSELHYDRLA